MSPIFVAECDYEGDLGIFATLEAAQKAVMDGRGTGRGDSVSQRELNDSGEYLEQRSFRVCDECEQFYELPDPHDVFDLYRCSPHAEVARVKQKVSA